MSTSRRPTLGLVGGTEAAAPLDAGDDTAAPPKYWAFVSYSHRDEAVARALQKRLETYRLPRTLVGRVTSQGPVPRQARPVFRDRDDLHAGADLGAEVRSALATSRWLVVICSPDAARSPWVEREIVEFKRLHGEHRVLALIAAGEPYASRQPGREAEECFPNALRHALDADGEPRGTEQEPIAADLRVHADGPKRAPLKLLAGMVGVGFDELVRRDAARRLRWLGAIAAGSLAGMAVLSVLTVLAVQARNDARQQREQAEGLIEFMLTDLRKKLEPVGRLDALDAVGHKALAHYEAQPAERLDMAALGHRSRAQHLIGEIRQQRGHLDAALQAYQQAAATTQRLLAAAPGDPQRIFDHAQSEFWVGYVARERGQREAAEQAFQQYRLLAGQLRRIDPQQADWQMEAAYAAENLGVLRLDAARPAEALTYFEEARSLTAPLVSANAERAYDLAQTLGWMALAQTRLGRYGDAAELQRAKQALYLGLPDAARNQQAQQGLQNVSQELAQLALLEGRLDEALAHEQQSLVLAETVARRDAGNAWRSTNLWWSRLRLAEIQAARGDLSTVRAALPTLRTDLDRLVALDPSKIEITVSMRGRYLVLAAHHGDTPLAQRIDDLARYDDALQRLRDGGRTLNADALLNASAARFELAQLAAAQGEAERAGVLRRAVVADLTPLAAEGLPQIAATLARTQWALGERDAARAWRDRLQATSFRHPDLAALQNDIAGSAAR